VKALAIRVAAGAVLCAAGPVPVSAMPAAKLAAVASGLALEQNVRWVCGQHRCWWRADAHRPRATGVYSYGPSLYGYAPAGSAMDLPGTPAVTVQASTAGGGERASSRLKTAKPRGVPCHGQARGGTGSPVPPQPVRAAQ